jgi:hypothetical protein
LETTDGPAERRGTILAMENSAGSVKLNFFYFIGDKPREFGLRGCHNFLVVRGWKQRIRASGVPIPREIDDKGKVQMRQRGTGTKNKWSN